jgi:hypothetical protein
MTVDFDSINNEFRIASQPEGQKWTEKDRKDFEFFDEKGEYTPTMDLRRKLTLNQDSTLFTLKMEDLKTVKRVRYNK